SPQPPRSTLFPYTTLFRSAGGVPNLAPFSFFMAGGATPLSIAFSPTDTARGPKDTLKNIQDTAEFVVNTVHGEMTHGMNATSFGDRKSTRLNSSHVEISYA